LFHRGLDHVEKKKYSAHFVNRNVVQNSIEGRKGGKRSGKTKERIEEDKKLQG
jgi:hypothetical protein